MKKIINVLKNQPVGRIIAFGFASIILIGTILLLLPISVKNGSSVNLTDALFTSTSAVCVTGLITVDIADNFTPFGQAVVALLIQIGGLGITSVGVSLILAAGKRVSLKGHALVRESLNVDSFKGMVELVKTIVKTTLCFELVGMALSFIVFARDFPPLKALGVSAFHSISAFNNSGFDILGSFTNLIPYSENVFLNIVTALLIIFGGIGFLVIFDVAKKRCFKKLTLHSKIVMVTSFILIVLGTLLLKSTENISWLGAFFQSVSARTAGFCSYPIGEFTDSGLFVMILLMFVGASPGSTGGGIKTTTLFVLIQQVRSLYTKRNIGAFHRSIPGEAVGKALSITLVSLLFVCSATFILSIIEPSYSFIVLLFEVVSALGTVGLSTGITPALGVPAKILLMVAMFAGRVGMFTIISTWTNTPAPLTRYSEESVSIG